MIPLRAAVSLLAAWLSMSAFAADAPSDSRAAAIDAMFAAYNRADSPGAAVGVYRHGKPLLLRAYGQADLENTAPITQRTVFHIASISKQFTAFAIALLAREGRVDLDADVRRYLPYVPDFGHRITVRHLLHHTSGLRDQWKLFEMGGHDYHGLLKHQQILDMVARQHDLNFVPGTEYLYSNTNYTLLAEIVRVASGMTLRRYTTQRIFAPLGMSSTFFYDDASQIVPRRAQSYEPAGEGAWSRSLLNLETVGATSLFTTIEDMSLWARNLGHPIVGDAALIRQVFTLGRLSDGSEINYGFGFRELIVGGHRAFGHSGRDAGYNSFFAYFPESDFAFFIVTNAPINIASRYDEIVRLYVGQGSADAKWPGEVAASAKLAKVLPGRYLPMFGAGVVLESTPEGTVLRTGGRKSKLQFWSDGSFGVGPHYRQHYVAVRDRSGIVQAIERVSPRDRTRLRLERVEHSPQALTVRDDAAGDYRCPELDITYTLRIEDGRPTLRSLWSARTTTYVAVAPGRYEDVEGTRGVLRLEAGANHEPQALLLESDQARGLRCPRVSHN